ncbi:hypothetical protein JTE90_002856 [Oedothorax gibbosus]|uniref:Uncharacterized protein n=1 Tax=Oedothorax gibbosus TaxID=931172 RepID=A0AAV6TVN8_9ARAC|nr:hypothetical protein JTE90_002856 [Oedothorax gibbosus]
MHLIIFFAKVTLLIILRQEVNAAKGDNSCKLPAPVESFSASLYTALTVSTDPKITNSLELKGGEGALKFYTVLKKVLEGFGVCNAEMAAFTGARPIASGETLTLQDYFSKKSVTFGGVLYHNGLLGCGNSVSMSLDLFAHIRKVLKSLDQSKIESQLQGVMQGVVQFYMDLGLDLEDVTQQTSDEFADNFKDNNKCKAVAASN